MASKAIARIPAPATNLYDCHIEIALMGDGGVGKGSIITRYVNGTFTSSYCEYWNSKCLSLVIVRVCIFSLYCADRLSVKQLFLCE